jgi:membrane protease subunit (stomatin/prohibitin family)
MDEPQTGKVEKCKCPFCDAQIEGPAILCTRCGTALVECVSCGKQVRDGVRVCPHCGQPPR